MEIKLLKKTSKYLPLHTLYISFPDIGQNIGTQELYEKFQPTLCYVAKY